MSDVLYLVEPSKRSVQKILDDFPEQDKLDYDQYGSVHIAFSAPITQQIMQMLGQSKKVASRLQSIVEMNCQFEIFEDNIFTAPSGIQAYPIAKDIKKAVETIARQLLSVCSVLTEKPFIQI